MTDAGDPRLEPERFWARLRRALERVPVEDRTPPADARVGAVLVLLEDTDDGPSLVLTRRRRDLRSHPGQVSFAGGRLDDDETVTEAALREAYEEIGLDPDSVDVLGTGPVFFIPPSKFWVAPVVARWDAPHGLDPNPWEVDAILRTPVATLLERERWRHVPLSLRGSSWAWQLDDDLLWGATAMVVSQLLDVAVENWSNGRAPEDLGDDLARRPWEDMPRWSRRPRLDVDLPEIARESIVHVTRQQMTDVDRLLLEAGVGLSSLVEHAGRAVTSAVQGLMGGTGGVAVTVLAGPGGNGAGGLAAARLLAAAGADVTVWLTGEPRLPDQVQVLERAEVEVTRVDDDGPPGDARAGDVVVDAMLGMGAEPPLRGPVEATVEWLRRHDARVVSLDLPSGVSADDGLQGPCVTADVTVTIAAPKVGMRDLIVAPYLGDLYVADIGVPAWVWRAVGVDTPPAFDRGPLLRVTGPGTNDAATPDQAER